MKLGFRGKMNGLGFNIKHYISGFVIISLWDPGQITHLGRYLCLRHPQFQLKTVGAVGLHAFQNLVLPLFHLKEHEKT